MKQFFDGDSYYRFDFWKIGIDVHGSRSIGAGISIDFQPGPFMEITFLCFHILFIWQ